MAQTKAPIRSHKTGAEDELMGTAEDATLPVDGVADVPAGQPIVLVSEDDLLDASPAPDLRPAGEVIAELQARHGLTLEQSTVAYRLRHVVGCPADRQLEVRLEAREAVTAPGANPPNTPVTIVRCVECGESIMARRRPAERSR